MGDSLKILELDPVANKVLGGLDRVLHSLQGPLGGKMWGRTRPIFPAPRKFGGVLEAFPINIKRLVEFTVMISNSAPIFWSFHGTGHGASVDPGVVIYYRWINYFHSLFPMACPGGHWVFYIPQLSIANTLTPTSLAFLPSPCLVTTKYSALEPSFEIL